MNLLHLSDLHFQSDVSPLAPSLDWRQRLARFEFIEQGRPAAFRGAGKALSRLLSEGAGCEHLLVTGDLSAVGLREELAAAREALRPFADRLTLLPGNHDRTSAASAPLFEEIFAEWLRSDLPELCAEGPYPVVHLVGTEVAIVALDSGRVPVVPGIARGRVGQAQLGALRRILAHPRLRRRGVVVGVHHAPFRPDGSPDTRSHGMTDARELLAIADAHGVAVLCHGHIHHRYETRRRGLTPILGAGSSTQLGREGGFRLTLNRQGLQGSAFQGGGGPESATSRDSARAER